MRNLRAAKTDRFLVSLGFLSELPSLTKSEMPIEGYWEGIVAHKRKELRINVEFKSQPDGLQATIDITDLYILGYKLIQLPLYLKAKVEHPVRASIASSSRHDAQPMTSVSRKNPCCKGGPSTTLKSPQVTAAGLR